MPELVNTKNFTRHSVMTSKLENDSNDNYYQRNGCKKMHVTYLQHMFYCINITLTLHKDGGTQGDGYRLARMMFSYLISV